MWCPRCYATIKKGKNVCDGCGFKLDDLKTASNKNVKPAIKNGFRDDVFLSQTWPEDINKKKLTLYAIFLGMFGAHCLYVGRMLRGLYMLVSMIMLFIVAAIATMGISIYPIDFFIAMFAGPTIVFYVFDIVNILLEKFKVPVILKKDFDLKEANKNGKQK